jgi:hypothetical protein
MDRILRPGRILLATLMLIALVGGAKLIGISAARAAIPIDDGDDTEGPPVSGILDFRDVDFGNGLTECPQAGFRPSSPKPLDQRDKDQVEKISEGGDDRRTNLEYSCFPQDETSIAINPVNPRNIVGGANDYRLGWGASGFYSSTDNGENWYGGIRPFPTPTNGDDHINGGGDPGLVFDREGVVYYSDLHFERTNDTSGVFVSRSTNGGFTWSRPCIPFNTNGTDAGAVCGGNGDPRIPGDGVVANNQDNDNTLNGSVPMHDKPYIAAGPRPAGVTPVCFAPISKTTIPAGQPGCSNAIVGVDRLYVTWTIFFQGTATINFSYSDDRGHSWSPRRAISGSAPFCSFGQTANACDSNQFSTPTVSPADGGLYVAFENFNTEDENQYLLVRSRDGGQTFQGPFFITPVFDVNYPRSGGPSATRNRPDCAVRGQQNGRSVLTNSCFRVNSGGNVVVDKRGGAFADDLYLVMSDNRNGTKVSSNTDVFLFKSTDGGSTWRGPTRVNDDPSAQPTNRNCGITGQPACPTNVDTGNDQWFPWVDIGPRGDLVVVWMDRRLDTDSVASEWPTSRSRPGNYLTWFWGAQCSVGSPDSLECVAPTAAVIPQPTAPINPGNDLFPVQTVFPFRNFTISDVPSNHDYAFRAGIFIGDYNNVAIGPDNEAWAFWTDSRNGRSSRVQVGRNPACEQSDVFTDHFSARSGLAPRQAAKTDALFLVTPCPTAAVDKQDKHDN